METQKIYDGVGPCYHRVYSVPFRANSKIAHEAMKSLQRDPNQFSPQLIARFEKVKGEHQKLQSGDEFLIHITGPWDGPVRVADVTDEAFKLMTLEGHLEAGEVKFEIKKLNESEYLFQIESLARSKDELVDFCYDKVPIAKLMQTEMWTAFCENFVKQIDPNPHAEVNVLTERRDEKTGQWEKK